MRDGRYLPAPDTWPDTGPRRERELFRNVACSLRCPAPSGGGCDRLDKPGRDELAERGLRDTYVAADPDEADAPLLDQPTREPLGRAEHVGDLGHREEPFGWPAFPGCRHAALPVAERSEGPFPSARRLASSSACFQVMRSATTCRSRCAGGMWSGSPGVTGSHRS